jgi:hypothetical protein
VSRTPYALPRATRVLSFAALFATLSVAPLSAQIKQTGSADPMTKRPLTIDDYARWKNIEGAQISGDGKWVAYVLRLTNVPQTDSKPVLHILNLDNNQDVTVADGSGPTFSPDSRWVTYSIDPAAAPRGRGGRGGGGAPPAVTPSVNPAPGDSTTGGRGATPPAQPRRVELRELASGKVQSWQDVQSAIFSPTSSHLLLRRRAAAAGAAGAANAGAAFGGGRGGFGSGAPDGKGSDAMLHNLTTGHTLFI